MAKNTNQISEARMGEIALLLFTHQLAKDIPNAEELNRELPNKAKKIGISADEARGFIYTILPRALKIRLECETVNLVFTEKPQEKRGPCDP